MDQIIIYRVRHLLVTVDVLYCTYSTVDLLNPKSPDLQYTTKIKHDNNKLYLSDAPDFLLFYNIKSQCE